ncbi:polymorphic toxin type 15 domain-containing protein [Microbacterium sp. NPDC056234]|uniref:polymorphic toxin type 15 domain-containing protein n=1 Tax=Microbacterium sp. NPDC056234 TaxID=3345757 RepID=UPI0035E083BE
MGRVGDVLARPIMRALDDAAPNLKALADIPRKLRAKARGNQSGVRSIDRYDANATHVDITIQRFNRNPEHRTEQFDDQLNEQIDTLENTTMADWVLNRVDYLRNGRPHDSVVMQELTRDAAHNDALVEIMRENPGLDPATATRLVDQWMETQAALHRLDGIAGGDVTDVPRVGDGNVNSSLGRQWQDRVADLDAAVIDFIRNNPGVDLNTVFMNIRFR